MVHDGGIDPVDRCLLIFRQIFGHGWPWIEYKRCFLGCFVSSDSPILGGWGLHAWIPCKVINGFLSWLMVEWLGCTSAILQPNSLTYPVSRLNPTAGGATAMTNKEVGYHEAMMGLWVWAWHLKLGFHWVHRVEVQAPLLAVKKMNPNWLVSRMGCGIGYPNNLLADQADTSTAFNGETPTVWGCFRTSSYILFESTTSRCRCYVHCVKRFCENSRRRADGL